MRPERRAALTCVLALAAAAGCRGPAPPTPDALPAEAADPPLFLDVAAEAGLLFTYRNDEEANHYAILESLGGGVALLDYDGDGLLDVFLTGGGYFEGTEIKGHPCRLFRNLGGWKFRDVTAEAGLTGPWFYSHAAAVADYDRDGWPDLLVTGYGRVALYHNEPDGKGGRYFREVGDELGLRSDGWNTSAGWADLDGDGYPDLYVCRYVDWSFDHDPPCHYDARTRDVCPPKRFAGLTHRVFRNNAGKSFADVSAAAGLVPGGPHAGKGLGVLLADVDGDGRPDVYVANDTTDNFLYLNRSAPGTIRLAETGLRAGVARDGDGAANGSMGVDVADYDGRGLPSLFVTNYENEQHALYRNESKPGHLFFGYATAAAGLGVLGRKYVGWGTAFLDFDRGGREGLFVADGHAVRYPQGESARRPQRPVLLRNLGNGRFGDVGARGGPYFAAAHAGRGAAAGDLDNDGRVDLVVSHLNEPAAVLRNESAPDAHWLGVELVGKDHADVVGAKVVLETAGGRQTRFAKGGGSYASSGDRRHLFGLGPSAAAVRVTVTWPDRRVQHWDGLVPDRYHRLAQGRAAEAPPPRRGD